MQIKRCFNNRLYFTRDYYDLPLYKFVFTFPHLQLFLFLLNDIGRIS